MLAWICDLIIASEDAFFADPVVSMGVPGVEYFAHPWVLGSRFAKEFLFLGRGSLPKEPTKSAWLTALFREILNLKRSILRKESPQCPGLAWL